jgi:hypothetical protein
MPQCQFLFSAVFVFQKSYIRNILGIGRNKSRSSYLPDTNTEFKGETETSQDAATPLAAPGHGVAPPRRPLTLLFLLYIHFIGKTLRARVSIHKKYCKPPLSVTLVREGPEALPGTLPERGIITRGLLHRHSCLRSDA